MTALALTSDQLRARLDEIDTERRGLHDAAGDEPLDAEQQTRWDELDDEQTQLRQDLADAQIAEERAERTAASRARWGSLQVGGRSNPWDDLDSVRHMTDEAVQDRALTAIESTTYRGLARVSDDAKQNASKMVEFHPDAARMMMATGSPEYMQAFRSWLKAQGSPVYTAEEAEAVRASLSLTSANGGYALPFLLDPTLIHTGAATKNPIRQIARVESGTSDKWNGVTVSNVTTAWKAEASAFTDGSPTTGNVVIDAAMLTAYVTGSYEIFQDSNLLNQLPGLIGEAIDYAESAAFISGSGSDAPKGVITAVSGTSASLVTATTRGTFSSASIADTLALVNALPVRYEDTSTWVLNKATYRTIEQQMVGTGAVKAIEMTNGRNLFDLPVVRSSTMTSSTTSGNFVAVLGDFSQYIVYDRLGVNVEFIQNVVDGSGIPTGQRGLVAYKRVGGDVSDVNAFRLLKC